MVHEGLLAVEVAHGATRPGVAQGAIGSGVAPCATGFGVAPCATMPPTEFVFRDASGARLGGWPLLGPRIRLEPSVAVGPEVAHGAPAPDAVLDSAWLRDHMHWFSDGRRSLVVRPEYRDAFERLVDARRAG